MYFFTIYELYYSKNCKYLELYITKDTFNTIANNFKIIQVLLKCKFYKLFVTIDNTFHHG